MPRRAEGAELDGMTWDGVARQCGERHLPCAFLTREGVDGFFLAIFNELGTELEVLIHTSNGHSEVVYRRPARNPKTPQYPQQK